MSRTLSKAAFSALRWNYLGFVVRSGSNFVIGIFLARLLGPKPFGQLAAAALVIGIANLLADAGFTSALVQAPDITDIEIRYVFTLQFIIAAALTLICMATSGLVAGTFHDPGIRRVVIGIAPVFLLQAIGQTASALLRREMDFKAIQTAQVSSYLAGYLLIGLPLAFLGAGVWSLVAAQLSQSLFYSVQLYWRVRHSVLPTFDPSGLRLLRFGSKVTLANIANWGISNLDNAVVGHAFGSTSLGFYSRAFTLAGAPCDGIVGTVQQVLFTSCSRAEGRIEPIRKAYLASLSAIAVAVFPAFWAMSACAPTVMIGLYGEKWRPAADLFRPLVLAISINAVMAVAGPILASVDQVKREIQAQSLSLIVAVVCFAVTSHYTPTVLSWGVVGVYLFRFVAVTRPTLRILDIGWAEITRVLAGPALLGAAMAAALYGVQALAMHAGLRPLSTLLFLALSGAALLPLLLIPFGSFVMARPLVNLLRTGMASMPPAVTDILDRMSRQQERRQAKETPVSTAPSAMPRLFIATNMKKVGETGVHTHFNTLSAYLESLQTTVEIMTPYEAPATLRRAVGVGMRLIRPFSVELAWRFRDRFYAELLHLRMRQMLPSDQPWIVYAQCPVSSAIAQRFRTRVDQRIVLVTHFNESHAEEMVESGLIRHGGSFYQDIQAKERAALLGADRVLYVSAYMRDFLHAAHPGLANRPSTVLPNFVRAPEPLDDGYGGDLVSIGTLEARKNQSFLLEVLAAAKRKGKRYTLTLFGTGLPEGEWKQLAVHLSIADQVTFAGHVAQASRRLHAFRAYVHAARIENLPVSLIEALACGLPILAPRVGGIPEIVKEGVNGFFWDLRSAEAAADLLIGLLEDNALLARLRAAALETYHQQFSADHLAPTLVSFLLHDTPIVADAKLDVLGGPAFEPFTAEMEVDPVHFP